MSEERVERRLAAIFAADIAGYSRLMARDEIFPITGETADRLIEGPRKAGVPER